jgi:hypothetical protein
MPTWPRRAERRRFFCVLGINHARLASRSSAGCSRNRVVRGGNELSMRAFACAIDFDPGTQSMELGQRQGALGAGFSRMDVDAGGCE